MNKPRMGLVLAATDWASCGCLLHFSAHGGGVPAVLGAMCFLALGSYELDWLPPGSVD